MPEQFVIYMKNLLHGDFGISTKTGRDIKTLIFESFHVSAKLGGMAILVALAFGLVFGSLAALTRNKPGSSDHFLFHFVYIPAQLCVCHIAAAGILCTAEADTGMGCQPSELCSSGYRAGGLSDGIHHPSDQDEYAGRNGAGLCAYGKSEGCGPLEGYI